MATLFVRHNVADFSTWKRAYDGFDGERRSLGVTDHGVYQADGNPNDVTVYHRFDTMDAARAFVSSPRVREVMARAGVQGEPTVWFATRV
jgi:heme-degrading monooxygenase HmoA